MPLSWSEIKSRALAFSRTWADAADENSQGKPFCLSCFDTKTSDFSSTPTKETPARPCTFTCEARRVNPNFGWHRLGSSGLDARTLRELQNAAEIHRELIERSWHECFA